jgi:hypothetical protein
MKGCANDYFPDFHVVAETATRPRLNCGLCVRQCEFINNVKPNQSLLA